MLPDKVHKSSIHIELNAKAKCLSEGCRKVSRLFVLNTRLSVLDIIP